MPLKFATISVLLLIYVCNLYLCLFPSFVGISPFFNITLRVFTGFRWSPYSPVVVVIRSKEGNKHKYKLQTHVLAKVQQLLQILMAFASRLICEVK